MKPTTVATATARLHNVLAKFEGGGEQSERVNLPAVRLDDAWHAVQPTQGGTTQTSAGQEVVVLVAGSMTLDIMACPHGDEHPQSGTTLPGKVLRQLEPERVSKVNGGVLHAHAVCRCHSSLVASPGISQMPCRA